MEPLLIPPPVHRRTLKKLALARFSFPNAGDDISIGMEVTLIVPIIMEEKLCLAIREGGRTVGAGVFASIVE